jgi:hypothetical protein
MTWIMDREILIDSQRTPTEREDAARRLGKVDDPATLELLLDMSGIESLSPRLSMAIGSSIAEIYLRTRHSIKEAPFHHFTTSTYEGFDTYVSRYERGPGTT